MAPDAAPTPLTFTDRVLVLAARAWGGDVGPDLWDTLPADRRVAVRWAWNAGPARDLSPHQAQALLGREHEAQARPDLARVHVSWWARALRDEPVSVRAAVVNHVAPAVADALRDELGLGPDDLVASRPPDPRALQTVLALWTERLVGDLPDRDDDPPAICALARLDAPTLTRLIRVAGLAKWSLTPSRPPGLGPGDLTRFERVRARLGNIDPRFRVVAGRDVADLGPGATHGEVRLGLVTLARLLASAEPYRVRWALQHVPYATARSIRTLMGPPGRRNPMLARWETDVLGAAWLTLKGEDRLAEPWRWGTAT
jgi:hypothetical protein